MRSAGFALLIAGFLLCLTISWAAIGFLAMSFGLIFLLIAEDRNRRAKRSKPSALVPTPMATDWTEAYGASPPQLFARPEPSITDQNRIASEADNWRSLVAHDEELSQAVNLLAPLGQQYVDQLASVYLVFNIKAYLPTILNLILGSAQVNAGLLDANDLRVDRLSPTVTSSKSGYPEAAAKTAANSEATFESTAPIDEAVIEHPAPPPSSAPAVSNDISDELDNLRDLLTRLDPNSGKRQ